MTRPGERTPELIASEYVLWMTDPNRKAFTNRGYKLHEELTKRVGALEAAMLIAEAQQTIKLMDPKAKICDPAESSVSAWFKK